MAANYRQGDRVWFRGEHEKEHAMRGTLETIQQGGLHGVRLENGSLIWAAYEQLSIQSERIHIDLELSPEDFDRLTAAVRLRAESCEENYRVFEYIDDKAQSESWRALLARVEECGTKKGLVPR